MEGKLSIREKYRNIMSIITEMKGKEYRRQTERFVDCSVQFD